MVKRREQTLPALVPHSAPVSSLFSPFRADHLPTGAGYWPQPHGPKPLAQGCGGALEGDLGKVWPGIIFSSCLCLLLDMTGWDHGRCADKRWAAAQTPKTLLPFNDLGREGKEGEKKPRCFPTHIPKVRS